MRRVQAIAHVLGGMLMVLAATYALPIAWSVAVGDGTTASFTEAGVATAALGLVLFLATWRSRAELQARDGALLVVLTWLLMAAAATVPLMLEIPGLSFTDAFFETISALTTTGATVLTGLDDLPQSLNVWRHALQWYGGMGIIVLAVAILPLLGVGGMQLFKAETPGPMKENKLTPRITQTAKYLWAVYATLTLLCALALWSAGMTPYEAVCHAFSAMSLGGFSTRDASVSGWNSVEIEVVLVVFMLLAVLNFTSHFLAWRERSVGAYWRDPEARWVWTLILGSGVALAGFLMWSGTYADPLVALRHAVFNTVSIATTTGYMSTDFDQWPLFAGLWMLLLCGIASSSGSTGGGIKMVRTLILFKEALRDMLRMSHPRAVQPLLLGGQIVPAPVIQAVLGFMLLYGATLGGLTLLLVATGMDLTTAVTAVVACLNNTGPGLARVGPSQNYQWMNDFQTWVCSFAMLAGRLELMTVFVLLTPAFWKR